MGYRYFSKPHSNHPDRSRLEPIGTSRSLRLKKKKEARGTGQVLAHRLVWSYLFRLRIGTRKGKLGLPESMRPHSKES